MLLPIRSLISLLVLAGATVPAVAQTLETREMDEAAVQANARATVGPATIQLRDLATLRLPKDFVFVPADASQRLVRGMGNAADGTTLGVVIPAARYNGWFINLAINETGHVSNEALAKLDAGDLRATIATATRRGNAARMQLGSSPIDAGTFLEPPRHEPASHRYTTAIRIFESGPSSNSDDSVNIDTFVFGRAHALQISLVDGQSDFATHRPAFISVVEGASFTAGHRAADFIPGQDAIATDVLDVVFGGRSAAELAAEAADNAAEAKRLSALPRPRSIATQIKLALFGVLGLLAALAGALAYGWRGAVDIKQGNGGTNSAIDRALRSSKR